MLRRLDSYVLAELVGPLGLGLLVYTFILLMQTFFGLAEMIIKRGLPAGTVAKLLLFNLPSIIVLTLPMSFLLAVLVGVGRLASDSELVALRASGVSLYRILRPVLLMGALLAAFNAFLMLEILPRGNSAYLRLFLDIATRTLGSQFEPRVFYNEFQGDRAVLSQDGADLSGADRPPGGIEQGRRGARHQGGGTPPGPEQLPHQPQGHARGPGEGWDTEEGGAGREGPRRLDRRGPEAAEAVRGRAARARGPSSREREDA